MFIKAAWIRLLVKVQAIYNFEHCGLGISCVQPAFHLAEICSCGAGSPSFLLLVAKCLVSGRLYSTLPSEALVHSLQFMERLVGQGAMHTNRICRAHSALLHGSANGRHEVLLKMHMKPGIAVQEAHSRQAGCPARNEKGQRGPFSVRAGHTPAPDFKRRHRVITGHRG